MKFTNLFLENWPWIVVCHVGFSIICGIVFSLLVIKKGKNGWEIKKESWLLMVFYGTNLLDIWSRLCEKSEIIIPRDSCQLIKTFIVTFIFSPVIILFYSFVFLLFVVFLGIIRFLFLGQIPKNIAYFKRNKKDYWQLPISLSPVVLFVCSSFFWGWKFWFSFLSRIINLPVKVVSKTVYFFENEQNIVIICFLLIAIFILVEFFRIIEDEKFRMIIETAKERWCVPFSNIKEDIRIKQPQQSYESMQTKRAQKAQEEINRIFG